MNGVEASSLYDLGRDGTHPIRPDGQKFSKRPRYLGYKGKDEDQSVLKRVHEFVRSAMKNVPPELWDEARERLERSSEEQVYWEMIILIIEHVQR